MFHNFWCSVLFLMDSSLLCMSDSDIFVRFYCKWCVDLSICYFILGTGWPLVGGKPGKVTRGISLQKWVREMSGEYEIRGSSMKQWGLILVWWLPPFLQIDIVGAMVDWFYLLPFYLWRVRGKIIRSVLCYIVHHNCAQCNSHTWTDLTVLWIGFCLTGPISLCLDSFLYMYYCMHV